MFFLEGAREEEEGFLCGMMGRIWSSLPISSEKGGSGDCEEREAATRVSRHGPIILSLT